MMAMLIASFIGYFAGGLFEQSPPAPITPQPSKEVITSDISHSKSQQIGGILGISDVTESKLKFQSDLLGSLDEDQQNHERSQGIKKYESILTQPNNLGDNEFEEFGLLGNSKPQDISNIETDQDKDLQKKPVKVVDSVAELEQLLNGIAVEKGKKWSATRTKLDESDMQTSASSLENIEFSIPPPPPPLSPSSLSMQHPRNHTVLSSQRGGRLNFPLTSSDRTPEDGETPKHNDNAPNWKLKLPKRFEKGVIPIHDVCIEPHPKPW
eukprot:CAMPEP_0114361900 /NCGR_PEP_ID=MMETSP0101-20121206/25179_1 /TAXON_ID=38822 ORGANISM="Pteridomonas danica, Strain PT" /NCGR_SAMPLE_ID=MMETSP0101 /ASSEMBLY_ACC=CAM_ASM_000211 /LENGTH=266 /DNA_ID=CAMNT_0001507305 /DNA_START=12 /DNA_END=810 /DNA_ORIENTATION=-